MTPKAFLFDMDGTMIDNMHFHLKAWEQAIAAMGSSLQGAALMRELYGKAEDVFVRIFGAGRFTEAELRQAALDKEAIYRKMYAPYIRLIDGLPEFLDAAKAAGIRMAIGTASNQHNVNFVVHRLELHRWFEVIVGADDVVNSKPHPETFLTAAARLQVAPEACVVFEDVPRGVEAAANAGMPAVVITTTHTEKDFTRYSNIIKTIPNFARLELTGLYSNPK